MKYLLIAGSRDFTDAETFRNVLRPVLREMRRSGEVPTIVEGGAKGADALARAHAEANGIDVIEIRADWKKYGRAAGPKRNDAMVEFIQGRGIALYFWDGKSKGTKQCIESAKKAGVPVLVYNTEEKRFTEITWTEAARFTETKGQE